MDDPKYNPATAFGNPVLIKRLKKEEARNAWLEASVPCDYCHEKGYLSHDCNCKLCSEQTEECFECDGQGRVSKDN